VEEIVVSHCFFVIRINITSRWDDIGLTYRSSTNKAASVTLYNTPLDTLSAVDVTALFVQDSYSAKRFTVTAGARYDAT
jgi:hypothetical protein